LSYSKNRLSVLRQLLVTLLTLPIFIAYPLVRFKALEKEIIRKPSPGLTAYPDERWFYINGVITDVGWLDQNCKYLEKRFGRGVVGILNRSYGAFWDLVESVLQRSFDIETISVRWAAWNILPSLRDDNIKTVRLIAHSQGAIIAHLAIKKLYTELS